MIFKGQCHCGAIGVALMSDRPPKKQALGACQCSFCRKHNARAFSDPRAHVTLTAADPAQLQRYTFGLRTSEQIVCRRCGVYAAMTLTQGDRVWSIINIDALDDRALFTRMAEPRDYRGGSRGPHRKEEGPVAPDNARRLASTRHKVGCFPTHGSPNGGVRSGGRDRGRKTGP